MGRLRAGKTSIRTLQKNNTGTYSITIPIELVRALRWQQGQRLVVKKRGTTLSVSDKE